MSIYEIVIWTWQFSYGDQATSGGSYRAYQTFFITASTKKRAIEAVRKAYPGCDVAQKKCRKLGPA